MYSCYYCNTHTDPGKYLFPSLSLSPFSWVALIVFKASLDEGFSAYGLQTAGFWQLFQISLWNYPKKSLLPVAARGPVSWLAKLEGSTR